MRARLGFLGLYLWLLSVSVLATIYVAWVIFPWEIDWLGLGRVTYMSSQQIMINFNHLMSYLTQFWVSSLAMPDFPSSANGIAHFVDVKGLFQLTQLIFLLGLVPSCYVFVREKGLLQTYAGSFRLAFLLPLGLALFGLVLGFDTVFLLFHQFFFAGKSNWLFNPYTDPVIKILPQTFFLHCFLIFLVSHEVIFGSLILWARKRNQRKSCHFKRIERSSDED